jgi:outer membrane autotransporter protein
VLYSRPTDIVQFTPYFGTAALTAFHGSLEPWLHRQHTLTDALEMSDVAPPAHSHYVDIWASPFGNRRVEDSVSELTYFKKTFSASMNYDQATYGVQGGIDFIARLGGNDAIMLGVFGGYLNSEITPDTVPVRGKFEGGSVGAYVSGKQGNLMLSALFKADLLDFDWTAPTLNESASSHVNVYGGRVEAALKQPVGARAAWVEPYGNLTYAKSDWDQFSVLATTFAIHDNDSLLGRLGLRVGTDVRGTENMLKVFAGVGVAHEFFGSNHADIVSGGFTLPLVHNLDPTSLELQGGLNWTNARGLSLSLTSSGRFSEDVQEYGGKAALNRKF